MILYGGGVSGFPALTKCLEPEIPASVRDDYARLTAFHMRGQVRLIFCGFIAAVPVLLYGASPGAGVLITRGVPAMILVTALVGLVILRRPIDWEAPSLEARRLARRIWQLCVIISALASLWSLASWGSAPPETRLYYPAILTLGALTLGYCLSSVRMVGISTLMVTLVPASLALALSGHRMDLVLAACMLIAACFQIVMMGTHQRLLLGLVEERHRSSALARRDSLTGLANRRALLEQFALWSGQETTLRLMVIDIDRFKAINDSYGHDMGDDVLRAFAELLRLHARGTICAARLGGEEFALLAPASALDPALALQLLDEIRGAYMPHGEGITASIGVAAAKATGPADWTALYRKADRALYAAKTEGRNRVNTVETSTAGSAEPLLPNEQRCA